jgi:hypothetical protein
MSVGIEKLIETVQHNCDIADAQHGGDYTMCTYLMKMREYFRWVGGYGFTDRIPADELGDWLEEREERFDELEEADFSSIEIDGHQADPFDAELINSWLNPHGLVYSAGLENCARAHFYLAHLDSSEQQQDGYSLHISGKELARGLNSPPAMMQESTIYLRREALRRLMWERHETWRWNSLDNPMGRAFAGYDLETDIEEALTLIADHELESVRQHEIGEYLAGQMLGDKWNHLLMAVSGTPAELMMRGLRDHLADCLTTIPYLVEEGRESSLHFLLGNLSGMRAKLFPSLRKEYESWRESGDRRSLLELAKRGQDHWQQLALAVLEIDTEDLRLRHRIEEVVNSSIL